PLDPVAHHPADDERGRFTGQQRMGEEVHAPCSGARRRCSASHTSAAAVSTTGSSEPTLSSVQPCVVTSAPEANEVSAITANTAKLIAAWALSFSSGR